MANERCENISVKIEVDTIEKETETFTIYFPRVDIICKE